MSTSHIKYISALKIKLLMWKPPTMMNSPLLSSFDTHLHTRLPPNAGLTAVAMVILLLWITLTWMFFPILALVAESASAGSVEGTARLRPWPAAEANSASGCDGETCFWDRCVLDSCGDRFGWRRHRLSIYFSRLLDIER